MTEDVEIVTAAPLRRATLPEWTNEPVLLLMLLVQSRRWDAIAERLKVQQEGGYAGIDGFIVLLLYFGSHCKTGLERFLERAAPHGENWRR